MKHFLVVFAASLVFMRIESEDIRGVNYPHEIPFLHDYTLYREHDILFTSPALDFCPPPPPPEYMFMFFSILAFFVGYNLFLGYVLVLDQVSLAHPN